MTRKTDTALLCLAVFWLSGCASTKALAPHPEYGTPQSLLATLRQNPDVQVQQQEGWTLAIDETHQRIWLFTPPTHAAHPAALKRELVEQEGVLVVRTGVLCGAPQPVCDELLQETERVDEILRGMLPGAE